MNRKAYFGLFSVLIILFSCSRVEKQAINSSEKLKRMVKVENYSKINLNDLQSYAINSIQYIDGVLYSLDENLMKIFLYKHIKDAFNLEKVISIDDRIADKIVGNEIGFSLIKNQFILINRSNVYYLNMEGELLSSYNLYNNGFRDKIGALPVVGTNNPVIRYNGKFYSTVYPDIDPFDKESRKNAYSVISFNEEESIDTFLDYPAVYENDYGYNFYNIYSDFNDNKNQYLISYPASDSVYIFDIDGKEKSQFNAKSPYLAEIKSWKNPINNYTDYTKFFIQSPSYSYIKYDSYNNVIFRFAENARSDFEYDDGKYWKEKHILCFDENFNLFDTIQLTDKYLPDMSFVTDTGLVIGKFQDEQTVLFDLFYVDKNIPQ